MTEQLRGILIDPKARTVEEVTLGRELQDIYDLIDVDVFSLARIGQRDWLYLDDLGTYRDEQSFWLCLLYNPSYPLINKALVLGDGESTSYTLEDIKAAVVFPVDKEKTNGQG